MAAVETTPLDITYLTGASGLGHPIVAAGADLKRRRLVVISGDPDGRSAALAHADINVANPQFRVVTARPIAINLATTAKALAHLFGQPAIMKKDLDRLSTMPEKTRRIMERRANQLLESGVLPSIQALGYAALNTSATWQDVIMQLSHVQFSFSSQSAADPDPAVVAFGSLVALDPADTDRRMGVCSVPLYDLSPTEAELFHSGVDIDSARQVLAQHDILQYFFPPPDHTALGLIEKHGPSSTTLLEWLSRSPGLGHPYGNSELVDTNSLAAVVDALQDRGLAIEGEVGFELTESGASTRLSVKFKPREGFLSKLSNVVAVKVDLTLRDLKDLLGR